MARGESGRIVIEVDPALKRELYAALALSGSTLKEWFVRSAESYCGNAHQPGLFEEPMNEDAPVVHAKEAHSA
jgi:hypothetical protein